MESIKYSLYKNTLYRVQFTRTMCKGVIGQAALITLIFKHVTWKSIGIIYSLRATPLPRLVLIEWRGQKILSRQHLVYRSTYRPTDSCKTTCPLFQGGHKNPLVVFHLLLRSMEYNFPPLIWPFIWKIFFGLFMHQIP